MYESSYIKMSRKGKSLETESRLVVAEVGGGVVDGEEGGTTANASEFLFRVIKYSGIR